MARSDRPARGGDERDVDFVVGAADAGADEDLVVRGDRSTRRLRVELGIGAAGLLVALLVARAALGHHGGTPQADPTTSTVPSSVLAVPTPAGPVTPPPLVDNGIIPSAEATSLPPSPLPKHVPLRHGSSPRACPGHRCSAADTLPVQVRDAIAAAFPESIVENSFSVRLRGGHRLLWYREVYVRLASQVLVMHVEAPTKGQHTRSGYRGSGGSITTYVDGTLGPWHVSLEVIDDLGGRADLSLLKRLAHDPRIAST